MIYFLSCKKHTKDDNIKPKLTKNQRPYISANFNICKKLKIKFISVREIRANGVLSNLFKNISILNSIF